jgi:hypothetical protein
LSIHFIASHIFLQVDKRLEDANAPDRSKIAIISSMLLTNSDSARASVDSIPPLFMKASDEPDGGNGGDDITTHVYHVRTADGRASWRHSIDDESLNRMLNEVATQLNVAALLPNGTPVSPGP